MLLPTDERVHTPGPQHGLAPISFSFQLLIGGALIALSAFVSRTYAPLFIVFLFVSNNFSLLGHAAALLLTALLVVLFVLAHALASPGPDQFQGEQVGGGAGLAVRQSYARVMLELCQSSGWASIIMLVELYHSSRV